MIYYSMSIMANIHAVNGIPETDLSNFGLYASLAELSASSDSTFKRGAKTLSKTFMSAIGKLATGGLTPDA